MAYFNPYPATYQPVYQQAQNGIIWVQGEAGAKSYLVAPNNTVQLWDSESQTIYLKSADASGMPSIKTLDYTIRETGKIGSNTPLSAQPGQSEYVTKSEMQAITGEIQALKKRIEEMEGEA